MRSTAWMTGLALLALVALTACASAPAEPPRDTSAVRRAVETLASLGAHPARCPGRHYGCADCESARSAYARLVVAASEAPASLVPYLKDGRPSWGSCNAGPGRWEKESIKIAIAEALLQAHGYPACYGSILDQLALHEAEARETGGLGAERDYYWRGFVSDWEAYAAGRGPLPRRSD